MTCFQTKKNIQHPCKASREPPKSNEEKNYFDVKTSVMLNGFVIPKTKKIYICTDCGTTSKSCNHYRYMYKCRTFGFSKKEVYFQVFTVKTYKENSQKSS